MINKKTQEEVLAFLKKYMVNGHAMELKDAVDFIEDAQSDKLLIEDVSVELGRAMTIDKQVHSIDIGTRHAYWEPSQELKDYHAALYNTAVSLGHDKTFQELTDQIGSTESELEWWLAWEQIHIKFFGEIEEINYPF